LKPPLHPSQPVLIAGRLTTDQKARSSNLFGRANLFNDLAHTTLGAHTSGNALGTPDDLYEFLTAANVIRERKRFFGAGHSILPMQNTGSAHTCTSSMSTHIVS
jgi:hypothetical protein